jgi:hypothetical protein
MGGTRKEVTSADNAALAERLQQSLRFNDRMIVVAVALLCVLFFLGAALTIYHRDAPKTISMIFGGAFLSLLLVIGWIRQLWWDKTVIDILIPLLNELSPEDASKAITTLYYKILKSRALGWFQLPRK